MRKISTTREAAEVLLNKLDVESLVAGAKMLAEKVRTSEVGGLRCLENALEFELKRRMEMAEAFLKGFSPEGGRSFSGLPAEAGCNANSLLGSEGVEEIIGLTGHLNLGSTRDIEGSALMLLYQRFAEAETRLRHQPRETDVGRAARLGREFSDAWFSHWGDA